MFYVLIIVLEPIGQKQHLSCQCNISPPDVPKIKYLLIK